jgi:hypothetical protein
MSGPTSKNANQKRFGKFAAANVPMHGKAANAGPKRGDNSHPPSNKAMANNTQYSPGVGAEANAAAKAKKD